MNCAATAALSVLLTVAQCAAGDYRQLPRAEDMQRFVDHIFADLNLHNSVVVVIDVKARGCAYATTVRGQQVIGVDPVCVGALMNGKGGYSWRAAGILAHECGHLLSGDTTNGKIDPTEESGSDQFSGWVLYRLGATLFEAQSHGRTLSLQGSRTHPGRAIRLDAIAEGWKRAAVQATMKTGPQGSPWGDLMRKPLPWVLGDRFGIASQEREHSQ